LLDFVNPCLEMLKIVLRLVILLRLSHLPLLYPAQQTLDSSVYPQGRTDADAE
jgi:hypothetical protein